jgi:hypothetical protein
VPLTHQALSGPTDHPRPSEPREMRGRVDEIWRRVSTNVATIAHAVSHEPEALKDLGVTFRPMPGGCQLLLPEDWATRMEPDPDPALRRYLLTLTLAEVKTNLGSGVKGATIGEDDGRITISFTYA